MAELADAVKSLGDALGTIFRHLLPGALVLYAVAVAHPSWFAKVDITKSEWLIVFGILAVAIGNVWFVIHRYLIQQVIDWFFWFFNAEGGPKKGNGYGVAVANHVWDAFSTQNVPNGIRQHIRFRSSCVVLMYMSAEIVIVATLLIEEASILRSYRLWILIAAAVIFFAAVVQNYLVRCIEGRAVKG